MFTSFLQAGIWTYHAKLYPPSGNALPSSSSSSSSSSAAEGGGRVTVDVVSQHDGSSSSGSSSASDPILLEAFTSADGASGEVDVYGHPVVIHARLTQGSHLPVLRARVVARVFRPGAAGGGGDGRPVELTLRDDGAGFPDVTEGDGVYSAAFSAFASVPGFYSVQVTADDNGGLARTVGPKRRRKPTGENGSDR